MSDALYNASAWILNIRLQPALTTLTTLLSRHALVSFFFAPPLDFCHLPCFFMRCFSVVLPCSLLLKVGENEDLCFKVSRIRACLQFRSSLHPLYTSAIFFASCMRCCTHSTLVSFFSAPLRLSLAHCF